MDPVIKDIIGLKEVLKKLDNRVGVPEASRRFLSRWALYTEGEAKRNMKRGPGGWVWKAHTRRSMTHDIRPATGMPQQARVGSNLKTARWGEFGTGLLSDDPQSARKRHWPPGEPLQAWAVAHGFQDIENGRTAGEQVAAIIGRRGGLKPRRYLRDASAAAAGRFPGWLKTLRADIERLAPESDH